MFIAKRKSRTSIITIPIQRHHIRSRNRSLLLTRFATRFATRTRLTNYPIWGSLTSNTTTIIIGLWIMISLEGVSARCDEVPAPSPSLANWTFGVDEAGHRLLVHDVGVFVVEGAQAEELLEQLPGANQVADADGDRGFANVP
jgi:hypothetical protein